MQAMNHTLKRCVLIGQFFDRTRDPVLMQNCQTQRQTNVAGDNLGVKSIIDDPAHTGSDPSPTAFAAFSSR